ncbi:leucine-rich repeat protein [Bacteroides sp.]
MKKLLLSLIGIFSSFMYSWGYSFETDGLFYTILSEKDKTVEVTYEYYYENEDNKTPYPEKLIIPSSVAYDGTSYKVVRIGEKAFACAIQLKSVVLPNTIENIYLEAFYRCSNLTSVTFSNTLKAIGKNSFSNCTSLTSITIPESVTTIEEGAFSGCTLLATIDVPNSVASIAFNTFYATQWYNNIPDNRFVRLGSVVFGYKGKKPETLQIEEGIKYIGRGAFRGPSSLRTLILPKSLRIIGREACESSSLTTVICSDGLETIESSAFRDCSNLTSISLPESLKTIDVFSFGACTSLTSIIVPASVTGIGHSAFEKCEQLKTITLPVLGQGDLASGNLGNWITSVFNRDINNYTLPKSLKTLIYTGKRIDFSSFSDLMIGSSKQDASTLDSLILENIETINGKLPKNIKHFAINKATSLPVKLLEYGYNLESLVLPFIGSGTQASASGDKGVLGALFGTEKDNNMKAVVQYYNNGKYKTYYLPVNLTKLAITEGCGELSYGALYGCSTLKELTLPSSLYMVGEEALHGCAGLTDIYNKGAAPAAAFDNSFTGVRTATCKLHIPQNTKPLYERSDGWKDFYYIQEEAPVKINVAKNIENAGVILGIEEYQTNDLAELKAYANSGYRFVAWTENGQIVSNDYTYIFSVTADRNLIAVFVPVLNDNDVEVSTDNNRINFTWQEEEGAQKYTLTVYKDASMTEIVKSISFDKNGNAITNRSTGTNTFTYSIEQLAAADYYYSLSSYDESDNLLSQRTGNCTVTSTGLDKVNHPNITCYATNGKLHVDNIYGLSVMIYTPQGVLVGSRTKANEKETFHLQKGLYIVRINNESRKILIR